MRSLRTIISLLLALGLVITACTSDDDAGTTTTTTTTPTTSSSTTTTTLPAAPEGFIIDVALNGDPGIAAAVQSLYGWVGDRELDPPDVPDGLLERLDELEVDRHHVVEAVMFDAELSGEDEDSSGARVAVVLADEDIVLLADEGTGWEVVGAALTRFGMEPWFGEPIRHVLVIGTDARIGFIQEVHRADSIHILSSNLDEGAGSILGFPRDSYVQASYGMDKFTHVNATSDRHSEEMVEIAAELSGLPLEGYLLTGFLGFINLVDEFGGVVVDVPYRMNDWRAEADLFAGVQRLMGENALAFSRIRSIPGSDFTRSFHHGVVVLAAMAELVERDFTHLPELVAMIDRHTWTDLSAGDLLTLAAVTFMLEPYAVTNTVLPGTVAVRGGASVVLLDEEASEEIFRDLDDGFLELQEEPEGDG